ncbi:unnamed protein product [Lymnaea stagnalis]|uniref:Uncharacterized protein n=1 Tax=Lymnaea stagnalis TaxID=6523 RepID=A0AAV2HG01_LYMST
MLNMATEDTINAIEQRLQDIETEDDLIAKHKKERRDMQAQIQKMKNAVPKGDKKKKKESTDQIAKLEAELDARQEEENDHFSRRTLKKEKEPNIVKEKITEDLENADSDDTQEPGVQNQGKKSKAQKRREKKQAKDKEREVRIKEQESENKLGPRQQEMAKIKAILKQRGLALFEVRPGSI